MTLTQWYIKYLESLTPEHREAWELFFSFKINPDGSMGEQLSGRENDEAQSKSNTESAGDNCGVGKNKETL